MNPISKLEKRTASLGNHYQKFLFIIRKYQKSLLKALEFSGKLMQVHLDRSCISPADEMNIIRDLSTDPKTQVHHLSCFYALQYLHMTFRNLDILALGIASETLREEVYHRFMMNIGQEFRELSVAYISCLLSIYLQDKEVPQFFLCSVGTRADQDDIDVGIITVDDADLTVLNRAIQKINQHMLVYATPWHLYLSENVGQQLYTTTISEYDQLLGKQIQDVVIISELLNARYMLGSHQLYEEFRHKIIDRYFYRPENSIRFHEGYLRGILGEVRALLLTPPQVDAIAPKYDAIRIVKSLLYAKKTIYNVEEVNAWDIIDALIRKEPHFRSEYQQLFNSISFIEIFKFLVQLFIIQEDSFRPDQIKPRQLDLLADRMGFKPIGMVSAWDQLLIEYYRHVSEIRRLAEVMITDITRHLSKVSTFVGMLRDAQQHNYDIIIPRAMIRAGRFYAGTKYWEDVLYEFDSNPDLVDAFILGFEKMPDRERARMIRLYAGMARYTMTTVLRLATILGKRQNIKLGKTVFLELNEAFLKLIEGLPRTAERIVRIFTYYPRILHEYLQIMPVDHFAYLDRIFESPQRSDELREYYDQLIDLFHIHKWSSRYFHRFFYRVTLRHPNYLKSLSDASQLYKISSGLLAMVEMYQDSEQKKKILGDYYDLEFLRVGIGTMRGADLEITNREFTEFCDNYIKKLFDVCQEEVEKDLRSGAPTTDMFAILAAGGHARGQAYDDDYDLIAIVDNGDSHIIKHATKIITKMNRELLKRGLLPHYRLGELLGSFVNPLNRVCDYLSSDESECFIDLSQLLGARIVIGSEEMGQIIYEKILKRFVFSRKEHYINKMITEIRNRQKLSMDICRDSCNLKEAGGGLRDIEAIALVLKAYSGATIPLSTDFMYEMKLMLPGLSEEIDRLIKALYTLRLIRNLYRLTEAAEDQIQPDYLSQLAHILKQNGRPELGSPQCIYSKIKEVLADSKDACDGIISYIKKNI